MVLRPLVIGPQQIPRMLELGDARKHPELATLAVIVHGLKPGSKSLGEVALRAALERLDADEGGSTLLLDLIMAFLDATTLRELEEEMELQTTRFSDFAKRHYAEGLARGQQEGQHVGQRQALVLVLEGRGLAPTPSQQERIEHCTDGERLAQWLRRASQVTGVEQLFDQ